MSRFIRDILFAELRSNMDLGLGNPNPAGLSDGSASEFMTTHRLISTRWLQERNMPANKLAPIWPPRLEQHYTTSTGWETQQNMTPNTLCPLNMSRRRITTVSYRPDQQDENDVQAAYKFKRLSEPCYFQPGFCNSKSSIA